MPFTQGIPTINVLAADLATSSDIILGDVTGFTFNLEAGRQLSWKLRGVFTLGATGGFRFRANSSAAPTAYNAEWMVVDETTPATFFDAQSAAADFTNASAVAGNYILWGKGYIIANAATTFSIQFAQNNSTVNAITLLRGLTLELRQF
jgi:hypothetical protein